MPSARSHILLVMGFLILGLMASEAHAANRPTSEASCTAADGKWFKLGMEQQPSCHQLPTQDGGKLCQKTTDCESECLAKEDGNEGHCSTREILPHEREKFDLFDRRGVLWKHGCRINDQGKKECMTVMY